MTAPPAASAEPAAAPVATAASWRAPALSLLALAAALLLLGLAAGGGGWSWHWAADAQLITDIRAPRSLGAFFAGALLAVSGALAQGLFRNPLADPYLLGSAAGASLAVVVALALGGALAATSWPAAPATVFDATSGFIVHLGLFGAAFLGALGGVLLTLLLAGGDSRPTLLLLCGVVVGVLLSAVNELLVSLFPELLRGRQQFVLGTTAHVGWPACLMLMATTALVVPAAWRLAAVLDALVLGEATAHSLGLPLARLRLALVALMALATGCAVAQVGLVAFVGLVAPHLVRRWAVLRHGPLLWLSALTGGVLLLAADVAARVLLAPRELPVGVLTAILGGLFLLHLLHRRGDLR